MQGHVYRSTTGKFERWYNPQWLSLDYMPTQPAKLEAIHDSLVASVVKRLMSDAPLGVLLSGGLDSSLVASIAVKCVLSLLHALLAWCSLMILVADTHQGLSIEQLCACMQENT
jgi:asparagine synthetase B (glutamine-hydrolysing)